MESRHANRLLQPPPQPGHSCHGFRPPDKGIGCHLEVGRLCGHCEGHKRHFPKSPSLFFRSLLLPSDLKGPLTEGFARMEESWPLAISKQMFEEAVKVGALLVDWIGGHHTDSVCFIPSA